MKKFLLMATVAAVALLANSQLASARRGGCGGGRGGCGGCGMMMGGCGMGGCGMMMGGCGMGGCGMMMGGHGMAMGGCVGCGSGGYVMGGGCPGGICYLNNAGTAVAQASSNEATLVVSLPEDATLTINDEQTTSTSSNRVFISPTLEQGKEYEYTLKAKVVREGKVQLATTKVTVRPGQVSNVELTIPAAGVAAQ